MARSPKMKDYDLPAALSVGSSSEQPYETGQYDMQRPLSKVRCEELLNFRRGRFCLPREGARGTSVPMSNDAEQQWSVLKLLDWTKEFFARSGVDAPRLAAEVLLAHTLGCQRIELYARFDQTPDDAQRAAFRELVRRAAEHQPIAYLVGYKEFYSLRMKVTPDVLVPRSETEMLVSEAVAHLRPLQRNTSAWDVCTGSGCVAVAMANQVETARVLATDISAPAVAVAAENAAAHGVADRVECRVADLLLLPDDCAEMSPFDVITANPPYVADGDEVADCVRHEPAAALFAGKDGLDFLRPIIADAPKFLRHRGALILEFGLGQADAVRDMVTSGKAFAEPKILRDHQQIERCAIATRR